MTQFYSDPTRESDPHALPDMEVFFVQARRTISGAPDTCTEAGWYYWACFPGCLPDGDPVGPFDSEADAIADARSYLD